MNKDRETGYSVHKGEGNVHTNEALTLALGLRKNLRPNWSCCHIWGIDDPIFQPSNLVVMDRRYFPALATWYCSPRRSRL
jgi:hypothetical protein